MLFDNGLPPQYMRVNGTAEKLWNVLGRKYIWPSTHVPGSASQECKWERLYVHPRGLWFLWIYYVKYFISREKVSREFLPARVSFFRPTNVALTWPKRGRGREAIHHFITDGTEYPPKCVFP